MDIIAFVYFVIKDLTPVISIQTVCLEKIICHHHHWVAKCAVHAFNLKTNVYYAPRNEVVGGILVSPCLSVCPSVRLSTNYMSYDNLSCVS